MERIWIWGDITRLEGKALIVPLCEKLSLSIYLVLLLTGNLPLLFDVTGVKNQNAHKNIVLHQRDKSGVLSKPFVEIMYNS